MYDNARRACDYFRSMCILPFPCRFWFTCRIRKFNLLFGTPNNWQYTVAMLIEFPRPGMHGDSEPKIGVSQPYSIIDGDVWVDAGYTPEGCSKLKNLKTGQVKIFR
jgi:hypothetical protein